MVLPAVAVHRNGMQLFTDVNVNDGQIVMQIKAQAAAPRQQRMSHGKSQATKGGTIIHGGDDGVNLRAFQQIVLPMAPVH